MMVERARIGPLLVLSCLFVKMFYSSPHIQTDTIGMHHDDNVTCEEANGGVEVHHDIVQELVSCHKDIICSVDLPCYKGESHPHG